jgi:hypothetical protein
MDKFNQEQITAIYETATNLLKISHHLREKDILAEIGTEVTLLADKTLKVIESMGIVEISAPENTPFMQDKKSPDHECVCGQCDPSEKDLCHGHTNPPENSEVMCNGHNAMGPDAGPVQDNVTSFPSGNSNPDIDNEIQNLLNKVKGQIND